MTEPASDTLSRSPRILRILSYNVHGCVGTDRRLDPGRIADVIAEIGPDIIGLQELDVGRRRSGGIDQAEEIARRLKMDFQFHPALRVEDEHYGDALLTSLPMQLRKAEALPSIGEPRGALWAEIEAGEKAIHVLNTHLGLLSRDRRQQVEHLCGPGWLGHPDLADQPVILIGDFNSIPSSRPYRLLAERLRDTKEETGQMPPATFPSRWPLLRLDHIFVAGGPTILKTATVTFPQARRASDHLPLLSLVEI